MNSPNDKYRSDRIIRRSQSANNSSWSYQAADKILQALTLTLHHGYRGAKSLSSSSRALAEQSYHRIGRHISDRRIVSLSRDDSSQIDARPLSPRRPPRPQRPKEQKKISPIIKKVLLALLAALILAPIFGIVALYAFVIAPLPSIRSIEDKALSQSSVIYDKNGGELYRFGEENRSYVGIADISQPIIDAIISIEDKTFYENPGIDIYGLTRVVLSRVFGLTDRITGASTISQQLIKNMVLNNERSLTRKIKEAWLAYELNNEYGKDKILELYLNKISFGHNAFGIESASKTFFGKSAKDVGVFGASILASLPKGPTLYSPLSNRDRVIGYPFLYPERTSGVNEFPEGSINNPERIQAFSKDLSVLKGFLGGIEISEETNQEVKLCNLEQSQFIDDSVVRVNNGCAILPRGQFFSFLTKIRLQTVYQGGGLNPEGSYFLEYYPGRKDSVLSRMYEDNKITFEQARDAVVAGFDYQFVRRSENIKAPHFVFYVREYLETNFGKDFDINSGIKIHTTLDPDLQAKAEALIKSQVAKNLDKKATSAALVSIDNSNGGILSMVGSHDYWDTPGNGQVNVVTSKRQPGSTFKPFSYAYAMSKFPVSPDTPVYDVNTDFGTWSPDNYDGKFMGRMSLRSALDYSRNIPAIKVFLYGGGNPAITKFVRSLGISSIAENNTHNSSLALGSAEVKPLEMAQAYSVFANGGWYKEVTPISYIEDVSGQVIYRTSEDAAKKPTLAFSQGASYLISTILSDTKSRPAGWNTYLALKGRPVAAKTGTSNKEITKTKILPRDLWTVGYTPQITTAVWAGNLNGKETLGSCDGLNCAGPIWRDYMQYAHAKLPVVQFERPKEGIYEVAISKVSGKIASSSTPKSLIITALFAVKPQQADAGNQIVEYDTLCNGMATDATPADSRRKGMILAVEPIIESSQSAWKKGLAMNWSNMEGVEEGVDILTDYKESPCERPKEGSQSLKISGDLPSGSLGFGQYPITLSYEAQAFARKAILFLDSKVLSTQEITGNQSQGSLSFAPSFDVSSVGQHTIRVVLYDRFGYSASIESRIAVSRNGQIAPIPIDTVEGSGSSSTPTPGITLITPSSGALSIKSNQSASIAFEVVGTATDTISVSIDGGLQLRTFEANRTRYQTSFDGLSIGDHVITIEAGSLRKNITLRVQ